MLHVRTQTNSVEIIRTSDSFPSAVTIVLLYNKKLKKEGLATLLPHAQPMNSLSLAVFYLFVGEGIRVSEILKNLQTMRFCMSL